MNRNTHTHTHIPRRQTVGRWQYIIAHNNTGIILKMIWFSISQCCDISRVLLVRVLLVFCLYIRHVYAGICVKLQVLEYSTD